MNFSEFIEELNREGYQKQAEMIKESIVDEIGIETAPSEETAFCLGESKIGGEPHLPPGFIWPQFKDKPLVFLAQINLEEIREYDTENLLPSSGMLVFFHEGGETVWGFDPGDRGGFQVVYLEDTVGLVRTPCRAELEEYYQFPPCKLTFSRRPSLPEDTEELGALLFGENAEEEEAFFDLLYEATGDTIHKLLGTPDLIQGDIFLESQLVTNGLYCGNPSGYNDPKAKTLQEGAKDWILLFQLDSDDNADMMWGDVGRIYFTIKKEDLKKRNFDAAWSAFQCS